MAFHFLSAPSDWVTLTPAARCGMYYDSDLSGGSVTYRMSWANEAIADAFDEADGTNMHGAISTVGLRPWTAAGSGGTVIWSTLSGAVKYTGSAVKSALYLTADKSDTDVTCDVRTSVGQAGVLIHAQNVPGNLLCIEPGQPLRLDDSIGHVYWTGSTVTAADTWYTIRIVISGTTWSVYLNGALEGTFTHTVNATSREVGVGVAPPSGTGTVPTGAQFRNFAVVGINHSATSYQVRNFYGDLVASGGLNGTEKAITIPDSALTQSRGGPYGSYDLFLFGADRGSGYRDTYGDAHFLRIKDDASFPGKVSPTIEATGIEWEIRARCQMGPGATRLMLDITGDDVTALNTLALFEADYLTDNFLAYETSTRPRFIIGHFPYYTPGLESRVTAAVALLAAHGVTHWEPRNEPQATPAATYVAEQAAFYAAVKAGDPNAVVLGPNPVSYASYDLAWLELFLSSGGDAYCDELSVHGYTDQSCIDKTMSALATFLAAVEPYGFTPDKIWQTEGGVYGILFGSYRPQSFILQILAQELLGIPWQQNVPWYDFSHGFWEFPSFWLTTSDSLPHGLTPRTFISEIGNRTLEQRFDFGGLDDLIYLGGSWLGSDGSRTIALRANNSWQAPVTFSVVGATSLTGVDMFGNTFDIAVTDGTASFPADPHIIYVRVPAGVICTFRPRTLTDSFAVTVTAPASTNNVAHLTDGLLQDDWASMHDTPTGVTKPYNSKTEIFPHEIVFDFAQTTVGRVLVLPLTAGWLWSAITDVTIDVYDGTWHRVYEQTASSACSFQAYTKSTNCRWYECWEPAKVFDAVFDPVVATRARITINGVSIGTFDTVGAFNAWWGEYGVQPDEWFAIRDVSLAGPVGEWEQPPATRDRFLLQFTAG